MPHHRDDSQQDKDRLLVTPLYGRQYRPAFRFCQQISKESFCLAAVWSAPAEREPTDLGLLEAGLNRAWR